MLNLEYRRGPAIRPRLAAEAHWQIWLERRIRRLAWTAEAWADYLYWQQQDRKTLKRINALINDAMRTPFSGLGKPEPLRENLSGCWSRRIDEANRLVYAVDNDRVTVIACRYNY